MLVKFAENFAPLGYWYIFNESCHNALSFAQALVDFARLFEDFQGCTTFFYTIPESGP